MSRAIYILSVYLCFLVHGLLTEYVMCDLNAPIFLIMCCACINILISAIWSRNTTYVATGGMFYISCLLTLSGICSTLSLGYISYHIRVLVKCAKPVAIIIVRTLSGKSVPKQDVINSVIISGSVFFFIYNDSKYNSATNQASTFFGIMLLCTSLCVDGIVALKQHTIRNRNIPAAQQMLWINMWTLGITGVIHAFIPYPAIDVRLGVSVLITGISLAIGQCFIYIIIVKYGSLVCSTVTTTRKLISILLSIYLFGHVLNYYQIVCIIPVFIIIFYY